MPQNSFMKRFLKVNLLAVLGLSLLLAGFGLFVMVQENAQILPSTIENPRLVVKKGERKLEFFDGDKLLKTYRVVLGFAPAGDKEIEGDGKTPLGEFYVFTKNEQSRFYLSLGLSYPNTDAAARGLRENLISQAEYDAIVQAIAEKRMPPQHTRLGGEIYIHGGGTANDWTWGCVALENDLMREIFDAVPAGAKVTILP
jgi:murein L,D-transpeptidase YafK